MILQARNTDVKRVLKKKQDTRSDAAGGNRCDGWFRAYRDPCSRSRRGCQMATTGVPTFPLSSSDVALSQVESGPSVNVYVRPLSHFPCRTGIASNPHCLVRNAGDDLIRSRDVVCVTLRWAFDPRPNSDTNWRFADLNPASNASVDAYLSEAVPVKIPAERSERRRIMRHVSPGP